MLLDFRSVEFATGPVTGPSSDGGWPNKRGVKALNYLTEREKKKIDELVAKLEAEINSLPVEETKTKEVAKTEQKIKQVSAQIVRLDPSLGQFIETLLQIAEINRTRTAAKMRQRERNKKALLMLLNG